MELFNPPGITMQSMSCSYFLRCQYLNIPNVGGNYWLQSLKNYRPYSECPTLSPDEHPKERGILLLQNFLSHFAQLLCFYPPDLFSFDISYYNITKVSKKGKTKNKKWFLLLDYVFFNRYAQALSGFPLPTSHFAAITNFNARYVKTMISFLQKYWRSFKKKIILYM